MPELAEVEFFRRRWDAGLGQRVVRVHLHAKSRVFTASETASLSRCLVGATLLSSEAAAKQMLFRFSRAGSADASGDAWLGIHLGMTGELTAQGIDFAPGKRDHLVLAQQSRCLVFTDPRTFGRVRFHIGAKAPTWWTDIAPAVLSPAFTREAVEQFLRRRARSPLKAVLLMQERFPGVGNWMADEILWRAALHPRRPAGSLTPAEVDALLREIRWVARHALKIIGAATTPALPDPPASWLFRHRWEDGGRCPRTGAPLVREQIGGRTTCWSPARQKIG